MRVFDFFVDKIQKALQKFTPKERTWVRSVVEKLDSGKIKGLDIKKLKGRDDIFRVRKGDIRIMYRFDAQRKMFVLAIEHRREDTYK